MKKIFFIFSMIWITTIIIGIAAYFFLIDEDKKGNEAVSIDKIIESSVEIPKMTTILADKSYIVIEFKIQTNSKNTAEELTKRDFQTKNIIIQELSDLTKSDLDGKAGKNLLQEKLKTEINNILSDGEVSQVYITSYIIQ